MRKILIWLRYYGLVILIIIIIIGIMFFGSWFIISCTVTTFEEFQKVGLKNILEEIWYGKEEAENTDTGQ